MRRLVLLLALSLTAPASPAFANTIECGGNSFSFGEVVSARRGKPQRGPIETVPDSLCADLVEARPGAIRSIEVVVDPSAGRDDSRQPGPARN